MGLLDLFALSVALGVDTLSVSLGLGTAGPSRRRVGQLVTAFALMASALVGVGYYMATGLRTLLRLVAESTGFGRLAGISPDILHEQAHFVLSLLATALLCGIGIQLILAQDTDTVGKRPFAVRGIWGLLWLATLVSIDAISAGVSLGMLEGTRALHAIVVVGVVNGGMSMCGLGLGRRLRALIGGRLRKAGGILLIGIAAKLIWGLLA